MRDLFAEKSIKPMLIGGTSRPFDSSDHIFELKLDGERCLAYLDPEEGTELRNKRNMKMLPKVPELANIHLQVKCRCILDGELAVMSGGVPDFFEIQRRSLTSNEFKIKLMSQRLPASFIAFDILYAEGRELMSLPLTERKLYLSENVDENERLAVSRYLEGNGRELYALTEQMGLEGIVAKLKNSRYYPEKRTKEWIKIKNLLDDDFVICGYIIKENNVISVVLGQYKQDELVYMGHATMGVSNSDFNIMKKAEKLKGPPFEKLPPGNEDAVWLEPALVCKVKYMMKTTGGSMRQPVFAGLRFDKDHRECVYET